MQPEDTDEDVAPPPPSLPDTDLYAVLNVARDASTAEIHAAFRRASLVYHPDKHAAQPQLKAHASQVFARLNHAHDVLTDLEQRRLYDLGGARALESRGQEVVLRGRSSAEVRAELDRLARWQAEERLDRLAKPSGQLTLGLDLTDLIDRQLQVQPEHRGARAGVSLHRLAMEHSAEVQLTQHDTLHVSGAVQRLRAAGSGVLGLTWQRLLRDNLRSQVSGQLEHGVGGSAEAALIYQRSPALQLTMGASGTSRWQPGLHCGLAWQLSSRLLGRLRYDWHTRDGLTASMQWSDGATTAVIRGTLTARQAGGATGLSLTVRRQFEAARLLVRGAVHWRLLDGAWAKLGARKAVSEQTALEASLSAGPALGVVLRLSVHRQRQSYSLPLMLSEQMSGLALLYGSALPALLYRVARQLVWQPWERQQAAAKRERERYEHRTRVQARRTEAAAARELMRETVASSRAVEAAAHGLLIERALFGHLLSQQEAEPAGDADVDASKDADADWLDVTLPLQALVYRSHVIIPENQIKADLTGFFDPCGDALPKSLFVRYRFRDVMHSAYFAEHDAVRLPQQKHRDLSGEPPAS